MTVAPDPLVVHHPWPFRACPSCGSGTFAPDSQGFDVFFVCVGCNARWRYLLGYLQQVGPQREPSAAPLISG